MTARKLGMVAALGAALVATACSATQFVATWKAPDAQKLDAANATVVALVMNANQAARRAAEDALAAEITERGARGIPMYSITAAADPTTEPEARAAVEKTGAVAVVAMRPVGKSIEVTSDPVMYTGPAYGPFWGGYYGYGWGDPWGMTAGGQIRTDTIVSVETLVYSLRQNKLIWGGQSKTTNPTKVDGLLREIVDATIKELKKEQLL